jgi:hypothetical protein
MYSINIIFSANRYEIIEVNKLLSKLVSDSIEHKTRYSFR